MNKKYFSIFFSVLLASTFVHELNAKCHKLAQIGNGEVEIICTDVGALTVTTVNNDKFIVANSTAGVVWAIDTTNSIVALFDGNTAKAVAFNLTSQTGVSINSSLCSCTWNISANYLEDFISTLPSFDKFFSVKNATYFDLDSIDPDVLGTVNGVLVNLFNNLYIQAQSNSNIGLGLLADVGGQLLILLNVVLPGFLNMIGSQVITLFSDLAYLQNVMIGLGYLSANAHNESLSGLLKKGLSLDLATVLGANDGVSLFIYILTALSAVVDVGVLGPLLNSDVYLFSILTQLGGNVNTGVTGLFKVVSVILLFDSNYSDLETLIGVIIKIVSEASQNSTNIDLTTNVNKLLGVFDKIGSDKLNGAVSILKNVLSGQYIVDGCNISLVISKLLNGLPGATGDKLLTLTVNVLILLDPIVEVGVSIPTSLLVLIMYLNSPLGCQYLQTLGINVGLDGGIEGSTMNKILAEIECLEKILKSPLDYITCYGAIKTVYDALQAAIHNSDKPSLDLSKLLSDASGVIVLILGTLQWTLDIVLGIIGSIISQVKAKYAASSSARFFMNINLYLAVNILIVTA